MNEYPRNAGSCREVRLCSFFLSKRLFLVSFGGVDLWACWAEPVLCSQRQSPRTLSSLPHGDIPSLPQLFQSSDFPTSSHSSHLQASWFRTTNWDYTHLPYYHRRFRNLSYTCYLTLYFESYILRPGRVFIILLQSNTNNSNSSEKKMLGRVQYEE